MASEAASSRLDLTYLAAATRTMHSMNSKRVRARSGFASRAIRPLTFVAMKMVSKSWQQQDQQGKEGVRGESA